MHHLRRPERSRNPGLAGWVALAALLPAGTAPGAPPRSARLRNDLSPGVLTICSFSVQAVRSTMGSGGTEGEVLTYAQEGRLTLFGLAPPHRGKADRTWMIELDEARVETLRRQGEEVAPLPTGAEAGLPPRAAHLRVDKASVTDAYASVAGGSPIQQAALLLALDVTHWPAEPVRPGDVWEHRIDNEYLTGLRTLSLAEIRGKGRERQAVVASTVAGEFRDALRDQARLERAESNCVWHLSEHSLLSLDSTIELTYQPQREPRRLTLELALERVDRRRLSRQQRDSVAEELDELTESIDRYLRGDRAEAVEALGRFEPAHPRSIWLPVARDLLVKAKYEGQKLESLTLGQLASVLVQLIARWQSIAVTDRPERLQPLRTTFGELVRIKGEDLRRLARDEDANIRAIAVFCFAFGSEEADRQMLIEACNDPQAKVRAWALYGLAEQGRSDTDPDILASALADADPKVRQRACMAIKTCVRRSSPARGRFADLLLDVVNSDPEVDVRTLAASALTRLASKKHLPQLAEIRAREEHAPVRERLDHIIGLLGGASSTGAD